MRLKKVISDNRNGLCVMMEGMFNHLGIDILDMTTIIPLFLSFLGANLQMIGAVTTIRTILSSFVPLLLGDFVAATRSKRRFSLIYNGTSRGSMLLIAFLLLFDFSHETILIAFFVIIIYYSFCQPLTGLAWNYLIGAYMPPDKRATMLGILYSVSGVLIFLSSWIIKLIRSNPLLSEKMQYGWIFLIGGFFVATSAWWYLLMKEKQTDTEKPKAIHGKAYLLELLTCYKNYHFRQILYVNLFISISNSVNTFFFLFVQDTLHLPQESISNLIVVQTFGVMVGGFLTGWVSQRFGVKRMLMLLAILGLLVPAFGIWAMNGGAPMLCSALALIIIGFMKGGQIGYSSYILEIVPNEKTVYHMVARNLAMIPFSFASIMIGGIITQWGNQPVFLIQLLVCLGACWFTNRLELHIYR